MKAKTNHTATFSNIRILNLFRISATEVAWISIFLPCALLVLSTGCARVERRTMEVTAYCGCGQCCGWERGSWKYLKLNFWNRYVSAGARQGKPYTGHTASMTKPRPVYAGLISLDTLTHPYKLPHRVVLFPWLLLPHKGTIAADTAHHPFGEKIYIPGYGWGIVEDRGGAIKGPTRLDLYHRSHRAALKWGRQHVEVKIKKQ